MNQTMRLETLSARLILYLTAVTIIAIAVSAFAIVADYRRNAEKRFSDLLTANVFALMASVELDGQGKLSGVPELGDARFNQYNSGWYWSVSSQTNSDNRITSRSLSSRVLEVPSDIALDRTFQREFQITGVGGNRLSGVEAQVFLGEGDRLFSFLIAGNRDELMTEISQFTFRLIMFLAGFGIALITASYFIVQLGLRPLTQAREELAKVRKGTREKITGDYPLEVRPLIDETNALISSNIAIVERSRTQVGNLAHSLKTPTAVMKNVLTGKIDPNSKLLLEQIEQINSQTKVYLDRARISTRYSSVTSRTDVMGELVKLVSVMRKLTPDLNFALEQSFKEPVFFAGDGGDFQELFGNLLENAAKFASKNVGVSVDYGESINLFVVKVGDDGPGIAQEDRKNVLRRGTRLDEAMPGSGLGLSIVKEILTNYGGEIELDKSTLGGLQVSITLPLVTDYSN